MNYRVWWPLLIATVVISALWSVFVIVLFHPDKSQVLFLSLNLIIPLFLIHLLFVGIAFRNFEKHEKSRVFVMLAASLTGFTVPFIVTMGQRLTSKEGWDSFDLVALLAQLTLIFLVIIHLSYYYRLWKRQQKRTVTQPH